MTRRTSRDSLTRALLRRSVGGLLGLALLAAPPPALALDSDADGLDDAAELAAGTDPFDPDTDGDGLLDGNEVGGVGFGPPRSVPSPTTASGLYSVAVADFDGDGDADLVGVNGNLEWFPNLDGRGTFGSPILIALGTRSGGVAAADVDGDGDQDVVCATCGAWYENTDGLGTFGPARSLAGFSLATVAADLDGDGDMDLAFNDSWYENEDGRGSFGPAQVAAPAGLTHVTGLYAADLDLDGHIDLISWHQDPTTGYFQAYWSPGTGGAGGFGTPIRLSLSDDVDAVVPADLDGDGDQDVVYQGRSRFFPYSGELGWAANPLAEDGSPKTTNWADHPISPDSSSSTDPVVADWDGDGDLDLAYVEGYEVQWRENLDARGSFGPKRLIASYFAASPRVADMVGADLDGDGDQDLLVAYSAAGGLFLDLEWHPGGQPTDPLVADTDGDGLLDGFEVSHGFAPEVPGEENQDPDGDGLDNLAEQGFGTDPKRSDTDRDGLADAFELANGTDPTRFEIDHDADGLGSRVELALGTGFLDPDSDADGLLDGDELGSGLFDAERVVALGLGSPRGLLASDLDGDGHLDLVAGGRSGNAPCATLGWFLNADGQGHFGDFRPALSASGLCVGNFSALDLDGDGDVDLTGQWFNTVWRFLLDGLGNVESLRSFFHSPDAIEDTAPADMDGDGDLDLVMGGWQRGNTIWLENVPGAGTWPSHTVTHLHRASGTEVVVFPVDVDGDGDLDVVTANEGNDRVSWIENLDGVGGRFAVERTISGALDGPTDVAAADLDGDGDVDVVTSSRNDDKIAWYENLDGAGSFGPQRILATSAAAPMSIVAVDLDGDGDIDVASASEADDKIAWYENDGSGQFSAEQVVSSTADGAQAVGAADLDGDGDLDLFSASANDGKIAWYPQRNLADPLDPDSDADGLGDGQEVALGTDPLGEDADADGVYDRADNCRALANPSQLDAPYDGFGNACDCDFDGDGFCAIGDFNLFLADFSAAADSGLGTDMNGDGAVGIGDFNLFLPGFQAGVPGPVAAP